MIKWHKVNIRDAGVISACVFAAALFVIQVDLIQDSRFERTITTEELIALGVFTFCLFGFFTWRRIRELDREIATRVRAEQEARRLAHQDPLTGLANRRQLYNALNAAIFSPPSAEEAHVLLMLDLNGFKKVNDQFGHRAGDLLLVEIAKRLTHIMREGETLARLGGDEFAVVCRNVSGPEGAISVAKRILKCLEAPILIGPNSHQIGIGIGITVMTQETIEPDELIRRADVALYKAKADTRSAFAFYDEKMDKNARERALLEHDLGLAIGTDDLVPYYQPIVNLQTGKVTGFEALARWNHPLLGNITPDRFIPIAEDCGLIRDLSERLFRQACTDAACWPSSVRLSFNISPLLLHEETFGLRIIQTLNECGFPPNRLQLEITENALVRDLEMATVVLGTLREAGIRLALDDFGVGASTLYHLRTIKLDTIKIDRSFIQKMGFEKESAAIVKALLGLAHGLDLSVTAEGVEELGQSITLGEDRCEEAQGFLFSRAVPASATHMFFESQTDLTSTRLAQVR